MTERPEDFGPGEWSEVNHVAGMTPWACSYDGPHGRMAITLYGTDADQVLNDNCADLLGLSVDGELVAVAPTVKRQTGSEE